MKLLTCTALAEQYGVDRNKLYLVTNELQEFGEVLYKSIECNITAAGIQHQGTKAVFEPTMLKGSLYSILHNIFSSDDKITSCLQKPDLVFNQGIFFEWIEIHEVEARIANLKQDRISIDAGLNGMFPADRAWAKEKIESAKAFAEFEHVQAMKALTAKL